MLKKLIEPNDAGIGRVFALAIQALIVISMVTFSIDTLPDISDSNRRWLEIIEAVIVVIFTIEYLLRIFYAENRLKFIFSFFGIIDFLAILPFYLSFGIDLRSIRALRLLRLFRILKLARYNEAINRSYTAFMLIREELVMFFAVALILIFLSSVGIYYFENDAQPEHFASVFDSLWWSVVTLTTVGYGDAYPITIGGRIFTFLVLMVGLGVISIPTGLISSALTQARAIEKQKKQLENTTKMDAE